MKEICPALSHWSKLKSKSAKKLMSSSTKTGKLKLAISLPAQTAELGNETVTLYVPGAG